MYYRFVNVCGSGLVALGMIGHAALAADISVPSSAPEGAVALETGFLAFSIESAFFAQYAGSKDKPNAITQGLLSTLGDITGVPPQVRIGGNTQDYTTYDASQSEAMTSTTNPRSNTIGPAYFDAFGALPEGTKYTFPFNNGAVTSEVKSSNIAMAKLACKAIGDNLSFWEYGNEPDLYHSNGHRGSSYTSDQFIQDWTTGSSAVVEAIKEACPGMSTLFMAPSLTGASGSGGFKAATMLAGGLNKDGLVGQISAHNYIEGADAAGNYDLLDHSKSTAKIAGLVGAMNAVKATPSGSNLTFVLGETNSLYGGGKDGVSNAFQAALWTLDFSLLVASSGIKRAYFHQADDAPYNAWNFGDAAAVKAPFYGNVAAASFIGKDAGLEVAQFNMSSDNEAAYGAYASGNLVRVAVLNMRTDGGSQTYTLPADGVSEATVQRLSATSATETDPTAITFAGVSYRADGTASGVFKAEKAAISGGTLSVEVAAAEAVIIQFGAATNATSSKPATSPEDPVATSSGAAVPSATSPSSTKKHRTPCGSTTHAKSSKTTTPQGPGTGAAASTQSSSTERHRTKSCRSTTLVKSHRPSHAPAASTGAS